MDLANMRQGFLKAQAEIASAKKRYLQVQGKYAALLVQMAPCSLCRIPAGESCTKPSGVHTFPHAERVQAAKDLIAKK